MIFLLLDSGHIIIIDCARSFLLFTSLFSLILILHSYSWPPPPTLETSLMYLIYSLKITHTLTHVLVFYIQGLFYGSHLISDSTHLRS